MVAFIPLNFLNKVLHYCLAGLIICFSACSQEPHSQEDTTFTNSIDSTIKEVHPTVEDFDFREEKIKVILEGYFDKYNNREFLALQDYYASIVEQFIALKNIPAKRVSDEAREYFSDKRGVRFLPNLGEDLEDTQLEIHGNRCTVQVKTQISWQTSSNPRDTLWQEMNTVVAISDVLAFSAFVNIVLVLDEQYKIRSYQETKILRDKLQFIKDIQTYSENEKPLIIIPKDSWIEKGEFSRYTRADYSYSIFSNTLVQIYYKDQVYWIYIEDLNKTAVEEAI